ncbi:gliding motility-associated C-terminal domain-containing protein [Flavobacterium sp. UBA6135]|uniref:gliding motility-associated C-terminal domain-containing protein n=1 Tax=Flavobacterium sp. UBA6135 TaxID=1946553 RepID=UPI0025BC0A7D|nr:gliding motility-associated C-terminal domain-containing protein [Flavobacterium sp. UBA6135]
MFLLFLSSFAFAQVDNFTLEVNTINETCLGNGSMSFSVSGITPGATMSYAVFLLPNLTTPIAVLQTPSLTGLNAGNYGVVATQTLGADSGTQQVDVTIQNLIQTLTYTLQSIKENCGFDGQITVNVTNGNALLYEIFSGPIIIAPQALNVFTNLTAGLYQIRVFDVCGDAVVQTFTLQANNLAIIIDPVGFPNTILPTCNTITVSNFYGAATNSIISYPVQVEYTIFPPGGGIPIIINDVILNGSSTGTIINDIPFYNGQTYTFTIKFTDSCGNVFFRNNTISKALELAISSTQVGCLGMILGLSPSNYLPPYTINFLLSPIGFNPSQANLSHPGPFDEELILYGSASNPLPVGLYTIQVTDSCGRSATVTTEIVLEIAEPNITSWAGCQITSESGIQISAIPPTQIVSVNLIIAPSEYPNSLPENLSSFITNGLFIMNSNIFQGLYVFEVLDSCGEVYFLSSDVQPTNVFDIQFAQRPGCEIGFGGIRLSSEQEIVAVQLINAPSVFQGALPLNLTSNVNSNGIFNYGTVPAGEYTFVFDYLCDDLIYQATKVITIEGYEITNNQMSLFENCGSFNLQIQHASNGNLAQSFWLQKQNPLTGQWGHPLTGVVYNAGTVPNSNNSYFLNLNSINLNIAAVGNFRILKRFQTFNLTGAVQDCVAVLHEFIFTGGPRIIEVNSFLCSNGNLDTFVIAEGVPPLTYSITEKNGQPFIVNNNTSNLFLNLQPAIYNFQIQDSCGNIANSLFEISPLAPLQISVSNLCNGQNGSLSVQNYPFFTYQWYKATAPQVILSTSSQLQFSPFDLATNSGQYFVSISAQNPNSCSNQILSFTIDPDAGVPNAGQNESLSICESVENINLFSLFTSNYDSNGIWTDLLDSGALSGSNVDTSLLTPGTYQFQYTVFGFCDQSSQSIITIQFNAIPSLPVITSTTPICEGDQIQLTTPTINNATYHWFGPNGYESNLQNPIITNSTLSDEGNYFLYVTVNGCDSDIASTSIEVNPKPLFSVLGDNLLCNNQSSFLTINPLNFSVNESVFNWYLNGVFLISESEGVLEINQPGIYMVEAIVGDCETSESITINERLIEIPIEVQVLCIDNRKTITLVNANELVDYTINWTGPNNFTSQETILDITGLAIGNYEVTVTDSLGCSDSLSVEITNTNCTIPKGVSPNNDGLNDTFDLSNFDVLKVKIFNRYGMVVFEMNNYVNQWHGQDYNGNLLPTATYYYLVYFTDGSHKTGWVYLNRENN